MTCALGPIMFWSDAFQTTCYLLNKIPSQVLQNKTPLECLFKTPPDYLHMRVFGCECFPHIRPYNAHKLISRSLHCIFLGYSSLHRGYKCLHLPTNCLNISHYIVFNKDLFPFVAAQQEHSQSVGATLPSSITSPPLLLPTNPNHYQSTQLEPSSPLPNTIINLDPPKLFSTIMMLIQVHHPHLPKDHQLIRSTSIRWRKLIASLPIWTLCLIKLPNWLPLHHLIPWSHRLKLTSLNLKP